MLSLFRRPFKPALPPGQRVYAIGDVHGRLDLLETLLGRIHEDDATRGAAETHILLLGDMIDRGPDSAGVVRRVMAGDPRFASLGAVKGNHEASLLSVLEGDTRWLESWLGYGGRAALHSWGVARAVLDDGEADEIVAAAVQAVPHAEQMWLADLPTSCRHGDYVFVHAGIRPGVPITAQSDADLLWIRHEFLSDKRDHGACIVHGHTISRDPELRPNRIGIDTGAYMSGTLTAVGLEGGEQWFLATGPAAAAAA
nr:metallophosphoesterase family protein [Sphingomonas bacterium]